MKNRKSSTHKPRHYSYSFVCPTKNLNGEMKYFPKPISETHCPMCGKPKGSTPDSCNFTLL